MSATASDGVIEYFANGEWLAGDSLTVSENGTYSFRVTDAAGNETLQEVVVDQIDKVAPELPVSVADITEMTNKDVTVSATFAADSVLNEYSLNGGEWLTYDGGITFAENGSVSFRSTDAAGNVSEIATYVVSNIDKVAPEAPVVTVDERTCSVENVTVSATTSEGRIEFSYDGIEFTAFDGSLLVNSNKEIFFRAVDAVGNVSEVTSIVIANIYPFYDSADTVYNFVKKSYSSKITGKKQNNIGLCWQENAFADLLSVEGGFAVLLDAKNTISTIPENIRTIAGNVAIPAVKTGSFKVTSLPKRALNISRVNTGDVEIIRFSAVNITGGAKVGNVIGGKGGISEKVKTSDKKGVVTETVKYSKSVTASGKITVTASRVERISGYSKVTLDNGKVVELVNSNVKISNSDKTVGGKDDTITHTTTYSASGTATLKNGSYVDSISGFKTVKLSASTVDEIVLGSSYTEKYTLKKGVETPSSKKTYTGTVRLENSTVGSIVGMNKVTASKGFNTLESYTGSAGNDTLTINKNAVLALVAVDMAGGAKDKFVNNGTLVLTGDFDRSFISGKGEIVAASGVFDDWSEITGVLNLGATAEGFRSTKHENSDDSVKKAVKWDLKAGDYTGWLGSWDGNFVDKKGNPYFVEGEDTVDYIKFTVSKADAGKELSVSGVEEKNFTLFDKKGETSLDNLATGTYTLKLELDGTESTSYTLALA